MTGGWPFSMVMDDPQLEKAANTGLYKISSDSSTFGSARGCEVHVERRAPGSDQEIPLRPFVCAECGDDFNATTARGCLRD